MLGLRLTLDKPWNCVPAILRTKIGHWRSLRLFQDNIHLAPPGGQGIGDAISELFLP